ncbi:P-loop ATPase protein family [Kluyvera cryocrescens]|uniref:P-loop ATPase protein family n=1 Tax=Kluyvera cryocrescens TaxID=580 RepID=A0A485ASV4_KLUCR|nr:P-loop ATPase protein family [Kluyvera cryocrescens]
MSVHELAEMLRTRLLGKRERELTMVFRVLRLQARYSRSMPITSLMCASCPTHTGSPKLRPMTGLDKPVAAFLDRHTEVHQLYLPDAVAILSYGYLCWKPTTVAI